MPRFVVLGRTATASPGFPLDDLPGSSGRLDVLLRCLRSALLVSHGLRRDTTVYLVLLGGPSAPKTLRVEGAIAKFVRPDEWSLAVMVRKALAQPIEPTEPAGFTALRHGLSLAAGGLDVVLRDVGDGPRYLLDEGAPDVRDAAFAQGDPVFFVGDHLGLDEATRALLLEQGAARLGLGPVSVHAEDAIVLVANELDCRRAQTRTGQAGQAG